uniref:C-type lectin domain-containing protein n=1 Tax=Varanus komodoensis TaxID=61221 RepID=A0A8D2LJG0_VARKO
MSKPAPRSLCPPAPPCAPPPPPPPPAPPWPNSSLVVAVHPCGEERGTLFCLEVTGFSLFIAACPPFVRDWTSFQGSYYFLSHSPGPWDVANQSCTSMGSHLLVINSAKEKVALSQTRSCWIGLIDQVLESDWTWVDGTPILSFDFSSYWGQNEPNGGKAENCALMRNSLWYDYPCKESYHWICERKR